MPPGLREGGVDLPGARKTTATSDSPCSRPLNPGLRRSRNAATVAVSIRMPVQKSRGIAESWKRNETLYQIRRQIPLHPLNRDRGESRDSSPPTPPYVRVRIRRFDGLSMLCTSDSCKAERFEEGVREGNAEPRADADPPRATWASSGFSRLIPADAAASQFSIASGSVSPLLPDEGT